MVVRRIKVKVLPTYIHIIIIPAVSDNSNNSQHLRVDIPFTFNNSYVGNEYVFAEL